MINVSAAFKEQMEKRSNFTSRASVLFADGTEISLTKSDFTVANNSFTDAAGASALPLGEAICRTIQIEIMNDEDQYSGYDFFGAQITLFLDFVLDDETTESIKIGRFTVLTPATRGDTVIISASDDMWKADKPYQTALTYPATIQAVFDEACAACSLSPVSETFPNYDQTVPAPIMAEETTYRQVFGYIAMAAGGNARINRDGYLEILTYSFADSENAADHELESWQQLTVDTSDVTITGLQTMTATDEESEQEPQEVVVGESGYVLSLENPIFATQEQAVLTSIGAHLIGKTFRKFDGNYIANPTIEFMDTAKITDRKGNIYYSVITDMDFVFGSFTVLANSAESAIQTNSSYSSPAKAAIIETKKLIAQERNARERAYDRLAETLATSSGLYRTDDVQPDGSTIYYLHDKPTLAGSASVIKVTADAIGFSTDGGQTFPYGVQINGAVIASILSAEGINADWINTGTIRSLSGDLFIDLINGTFSLGQERISYDGSTLSINADTISIGSSPVASSADLQDASEALQGQINEITDALEEQSGFIRITPSTPEIQLGKENSDAHVSVTNDEVSIVAGNASTVIGSSALRTTQAVIQSVQFGEYAWEYRSNGHLTLKYVGAQS